MELAQKSVLGTLTEYDAYGVITEAFILHKKLVDHYMIFPQLFLQWKPDVTSDRQGALPNFGIGCYYDTHPFMHLQGGAEVKAAIPLMHLLPPPDTVSHLPHVRNTLHSCYFQAEEQAKATVKGHYLPADQQISWLMFVGPYFTKLNLLPFTAAQLQTHSHKPNDSGGYMEGLVIEMKKHAAPPVYPLYLLGTKEAADEMEDFLTSTSHFL